MKVKLTNNEDFTVERGNVSVNVLDLSTKQDALVSGTNIKTINNESILGSGNISIAASGVETDPVFSASAAAGITSSDITNWNGKTSNTGTVTGVKMNGTTNNPTSGVVDLGTVITSETSLSKGTTTGSGNAVTDISVSGHTITLTKGSTFLESGTTLDSISDGTTRKLANYLPLSGGTMTGAVTFPTASSATDNTKGINFANGSSVIAHVGTSTLMGLYSNGKIVLRPNGATSSATGNGSVEIANDGIIAKEVITAEGFAKSGGTSSQFLKADGSVDNNTYLTSFTEVDPVFTASVASGITSSDISNWNSKTDNVGTVTGVKMNGTTNNPTSGVVDLGTVITSETSLSKGTTTGSGNAVTDISVNGHQITLTKGTTFLTSHQDITGLADGIYYDSTNKRIYLRNGSNNLSGSYAYIDATDFIKDGMVDSVTVGNGTGSNAGVTCLIITFNTFDGSPTHQTIELPISQIFNASNYYTKSDIDNAGYLTSFTEVDPVFTASVASGITSSDISNWNGKTSNVGTVTGVKMNGTTNNPTSGVVDLGTVITSETTLSKGTTTGNGNAVTDISVNGHQITLTKGTTFLTSHQTLKTINNNAITGSGNLTINELPTVTSSDNGKILMVVNGAWALVSPSTIYTGTGTPSSGTGNNGDIYLQTN